MSAMQMENPAAAAAPMDVAAGAGHMQQEEEEEVSGPRGGAEAARPVAGLTGSLFDCLGCCAGCGRIPPYF